MRRPQSVALRIQDDGTGFVPEPDRELVAHERFGLLTMRERVEQAEGIWRLESAAGQGTVVHAELPIGPAA